MILKSVATTITARNRAHAKILSVHILVSVNRDGFSMKLHLNARIMMNVNQKESCLILKTEHFQSPFSFDKMANTKKRIIL